MGPVAGVPDRAAEALGAAAIPLGRAGIPADVASVVGYLESHSAGLIYGAILDVNGAQ